MSGPSDQSVRMPAVAGVFYPEQPEACLRMVESFLKTGKRVAGMKKGNGKGGIVPHAGWICSGEIAGETIGELMKGDAPDLVVVFGAVHTGIAMERAALDSHARWMMPMGASDQPGELRKRLLEDVARFVMDDRFHRYEHAVEVELPLIQGAWADVEVLPVEVPVVEEAPEMGRVVARWATEVYRRPIFLASSDLTHYGPSYDFAPAGVGQEGLEWAKGNDRRLLDLVAGMRVESIVPDVRAHRSACGGGAIAAMLAACSEMGAKSARVIRHENSSETLARAGRGERMDDAVGYAAVIVE